MIKLRFWGVRGSIPSPGAHTVNTGGNTSCIELRYGGADHLIIIDAGTGIRALGEFLVRSASETDPIHASLFLTHTHWDHIMGFPFFAPIYRKGTELDLYGPVTWEDESLKKVIGHQLNYQYFPVHSGELAATLRYHELRQERVELADGMVVHTTYLNHPVLCLGYRFEYRGTTVVTAFDTEPFRNLFPTDPSQAGFDPDIAAEGARAAHEENARLLSFYQNADLLIHDAQYTREEHQRTRMGWGHSSFEDAIENGLASSAARLLLFHHDPERHDDAFEEILSRCRSLAAKRNMQVDIATEGLVIELPDAQ